MTREQHNILYSIDITAFCHNSQGLHLCPRLRDYNYFVYWSEFFCEPQKGFGSTVGKNKIQIARETGEEIVSLGEVVKPCPGSVKEKRVQMIYPLESWETGHVNKVKELETSLGLAIEAVAIEKTFVLKENRGWKDMPMIDFMDAFEQCALLTHFKSLFQCYLNEIIFGQDGAQVLQRMIVLLSNWEKIYDEKDNILHQVERYVELIVQGIEEQNESFEDLTYLTGKIKEKISLKGKADDILHFLLKDDSNREQFQECAAVLKKYLETYGKEDATVSELLNYLQKYAIADLQISNIWKLKKLDLTPKISKISKIANARLIEGYLADKVKNGGNRLFENVA